MTGVGTPPLFRVFMGTDPVTDSERNLAYPQSPSPNRPLRGSICAARTARYFYGRFIENGLAFTPSQNAP